MASYRFEIVTAPTSEPVSLADLKDHCNLILSDDDTKLASYLTATRELFEQLTDYTLITTEYKMYLGYFPCRQIVIPKFPLQSITSIHYYDTDGVDQTYTTYELDLKARTIKPQINTTFPVASCYKGPPITIQFKAGVDSAANIPENVKLAIKLQAAAFYMVRESITDVNYKDLPMGFQMIVNQFKSGLQYDLNEDRNYYPRHYPLYAYRY